MTDLQSPPSLKEQLSSCLPSLGKSGDDLESLSPEQTEELKQELRTLCLENLYFLAKAVLNYKDLQPSPHMEVTEILQRRTCEKHPELCQNKMIVLPRGHLKTTICTKSYPIWRYLRNREIRMLICNETATNAEMFLREIKGHFERNELFRWLFPECLPSKEAKWTDNEITLPREGNYSEGTIQTIGVGGAVVSRHYDLIIFDDLVGLEASLNTELMTKIVDWYKYATGLLVSPGESEMLIVGTRWAYADLVSHILEEEPDYDSVVRSCKENGVPIWPERFPERVLLAILDRQGPRIFSTQYMNDPTQENPASFEKEWIRHYSVVPVGLNIVTVIDPAIGKTAQADFTSILTLGMDWERMIYLLDLTADRIGVDEMMDEIVRHYGTWRSKKLGIETIFFQKVLMWPLREAMRRHKMTMNVEEFSNLGAKSKVARIAATHPYFARGHVFAPANESGWGRFYKEFKEFPAGAHDDVLDTVAMGIQLLTPPDKLESPAKDPLSYEAIKEDIEKIARGRAGEGVWAWHKEVRV